MIEARLTVNGKTVEFQIAGPLVTLAPAAKKQPKATKTPKGAK